MSAWCENGHCGNCGRCRDKAADAADRVRVKLEKYNRGVMDRPVGPQLSEALEIALEALEQYDMAAPYPPGKPTRASIAIERMADALEGKQEDTPWAV